MLDLEPTTKITVYALVWALLLLLVAARGDARAKSVGFPHALLLSYIFAYGGALVYLVPGYSPANSAYLRAWRFDAATVADGFELTTIGIIGAFCGFGIFSLFGTDPPALRKAGTHGHRLHQMSIFLLTVGSLAALIMKFIASLGLQLAGVQAVGTAVQNLLIVGACAYIYNKVRIGDERKAFIACVVFAILTPTFRLLTSAILSDSVGSSLSIVCFYLTVSGGAVSGRPGFLRRVTLLAGLLVCSLVFAASYLQGRQALRAVVWRGGSVEAALETSLQEVAKFSLDSIGSDKTLALLDARLDQSIFVGLAAERLRAQTDDFENGATIASALLAWVPRFIWPDKPERGGSAFIARYTGLRFSEGTTFGTGVIFEFYVNFGLPGVFFGMILIGYVLRSFDVAAFRTLRNQDYVGFARYLLIGFPLLAPLADVFFTVTSLAGAAIVGLSLRAVWSRVRNDAHQRGCITWTTYLSRCDRSGLP